VGWSYRIATVRGIDVKIHATFVLIVLLGAGNWSSLGLPGVAFGAALMLLLFACVTLHEFGHALAAQRYGIPVREIVLLPIGGVAMLGRNPRDAVQELVIAAAGPAVNVVIIAVLLPALWLLGEAATINTWLLRPRPDATLSLAEALQWLITANVNLVLFNLIPAFPLDGGRILRGLLGLSMDWRRATRWATGVGQGLAVVMGIGAVATGQIFLLVIAVLVFIGAAATSADEQARSILSMQRVGNACNRHEIALVEGDRLSSVVRHLLTGYQPDFAVMHGRELRGVVLRSSVLAALARRRGDVPVTTLMTTCPRVDAADSLADVRTTLEESGTQVAAVYDRHGFVGLVGLDDLGEAETVLAFLERAHGPNAAAWLTAPSGARGAEA
jgi:Zn-dependent protease